MKVSFGGHLFRLAASVSRKRPKRTASFVDNFLAVARPYRRQTLIEGQFDGRATREVVPPHFSCEHEREAATVGRDTGMLGLLEIGRDRRLLAIAIGKHERREIGTGTTIRECAGARGRYRRESVEGMHPLDTR